MDRDTVYSVWEQTCHELGLKIGPSIIPGEPPPEPGPVRRLSKKEIKQLQYKAPKAR